MKRYGTYALLCAGLIGILVAVWMARRDQFVPLEHLPTQNATVLRVDFSTLRKAGILGLLSAKPGLEEPEYRSFTQSSGFDYQKDLDGAWISFAPKATYFILQGRFDWQKLKSYAKANGGGCYQELCHLPGSQPERRISYLPLQKDLMALAVSTDDLAATRLRDRNPGREIEPSGEPVWMSVPAGALKRTAAMPAGTRLFASAVSTADRVMLTLGTKDGNYAARLQALCSTHKDAQSMTAELNKITTTLKDVVAKTHGSDELTGMLVAGSFQQDDKKVLGYWPIQKKLLESLAR